MLDTIWKRDVLGGYIKEQVQDMPLQMRSETLLFRFPSETLARFPTPAPTPVRYTALGFNALECLRRRFFGIR